MNSILRHSALILALPMVLSLSAYGQTPDASKAHDEAFKEVQVLHRSKKYPEAVALAREILGKPDLSATDKARFLNAAGAAAQIQQPLDADAAVAFYEAIVADPDIPLKAKVSAIQEIANVAILSTAGQNLDQIDLKPAYAILERALKLPDLQPADRALALKNIAALDERADRYADARKRYEEILQLEINDATKANTHQALADTYASEGNAKEAIALYGKHQFSLIPLYQKLGDYDRLNEEILKVLENREAPLNERWRAFTQFSELGNMNSTDPRVARRRMKQFMEAADRYLPGLLEGKPEGATVLMRRFKSIPVDGLHIDKILYLNPEFLIWAAPILLQSPKLSDADYSFVRAKYLEALSAQGDPAPVLKEAAALAADARVEAPIRFFGQLVGASANPAKWTQSEKTLSGIDKNGALLRAGQLFLRLNQPEVARRFYETAQSLVARPERASIPCPFVSQAPNDVGSWLASPLLKKGTGKLNRPYGDNLQILLETDAAVTGRDTDTKTKEPTGDTETDLHVACDETGLHFFIHAHDARIAQVVKGLARGGSLELYLAPGSQQAYITFLPKLPDGRMSTGSDAFVTMYPNSQYRAPSIEEGTLRSEGRVTDQGTAMAFSFAWDLFYDKLPSEGDQWQFEAFRWTRSGGFSFGGSESVHNRSSWGDIVFTGMTPERLTAIKRRIIFNAIAKYKAAKKITRPVGNWADKEVGDPLFHQQKVAPLLKKLDDYVEKATETMTPAEIDTLFREAVPGWMELEHHVAALRTGYLLDKHLAE